MFVISLYVHGFNNLMFAQALHFFNLSIPCSAPAWNFF